jgi:uncharacterized delta-60 repeat protein
VASLVNRTPEAPLSAESCWIGEFATLRSRFATFVSGGLSHRMERLAALAALSIVFGFSRPALAAPGDVDETYGQEGRVVFGFVGYQEATVVASTVDSEGRLVLVGRCEQTKNDYFCVSRLLQDGVLDSEFAQSGRRVIAEIGRGTPYAIAVQPDGRIVVGGSCVLSSRSTACVARLLANGEIDSSYGNNGVVSIGFDSINTVSTVVRSMRLAADGRLSLGIDCSVVNLGSRFCAARLTLDGALDATFGQNGAALIERTSGQQRLVSTALDANNRWLLAGTCFTSTQSFCAVRLLADGAKDASFGNAGEIVHRFANSTTHALQHLAFGPDQRIVLAGRCRIDQNEQSDRACAVGLTEDGVINNAFGEMGTLTYFTGADVGMAASANQFDGKRVVVSTCYQAQSATTAPDVCFYRLNTDGTHDASLQLRGDNQPRLQYAASVAIDAQGRILISGSCASVGSAVPDRFCVSRYEGGPYANTSCSLDVDGDGKLNAAVDGLIFVRASFGFAGDEVLRDIVFPQAANRTAWGGGGAADLRQYLVAHCGMMLSPVETPL